MEKHEISIPEGWHEVSIGKFQELSTYNVESSLTNSINILSCLTDTDEEVIKKMDHNDLKEVMNLLRWSQETPPSEFKHTININGVDYSLVPRLSEMTVGEWIDIEQYLENFIPNLHLIMAVLYRPLLTAVNDEARFVEKYDANKSVVAAELFKEHVSIADVYGAALFFSVIGIRFMNNLQAYLVQEQKTMETTKR